MNNSGNMCYHIKVLCILIVAGTTIAYGSLIHAYSFPSNPLKILSPKKTILSNGLPLIYQEDKTSSITIVQLLIHGGHRADPEGKAGLAYLTTRLSLEIPDQRKIQQLMSQASRISMACYGDYSLIRIACLSEHLESTLKTVTQILKKPLFSGLRIDRIKEQMLHQREKEEDEPAQIALQKGLNCFYSDSSYGSPILGSKESLDAIKKKDIEAFFNMHFKSENMVVAVVSDLKEDSIIQILKKYLEQIPEGTSPSQTAPTQSSKIQGEKQIEVEKDIKQVLISSIYPLPMLSLKNFTNTFLLANLLGKGINSRLWRLRSEEKLAYNVNANAILMRDGGIIEAYLETDNSKKLQAREALKKELADLFENGVSNEELLMTKFYLKSFLLRSNESKDTRAYNLAFFEAFNLGSDFLNDVFREIDNITIEEINAFIKEILDPQKEIQINVGPKDKAKNQQ
ncbi:MAG: pitrilysin family protein [Acidobacteriota bacterium]|nr:pitrilysin family protein [Acidobacteriota bacterium]